MRIDDLMLVEDVAVHEYDVHGDVALPVNGRRRPIDAGYPLTWTETPAGGGEPYQRSGLVLCTAPTERTVWVVPDERLDGEGYAVVVCDVVGATAAGAVREVGGPGDHLSTATWQAPRALPRALLRVDRVTYDGDTRTTTRLHARPQCPLPSPMSRRERIERGTPTPVESCYVYQRWLHPLSVRPVGPTSGGVCVPECGGCLHPGQPPKWKPSKAEAAK